MCLLQLIDLFCFSSFLFGVVIQPPVPIRLPLLFCRVFLHAQQISRSLSPTPLSNPKQTEAPAPYLVIAHATLPSTPPPSTSLAPRAMALAPALPVRRIRSLALPRGWLRAASHAVGISRWVVWAGHRAAGLSRVVWGVHAVGELDSEGRRHRRKKTTCEREECWWVSRVGVLVSCVLVCVCVGSAHLVVESISFVTWC